MSASSRGPVVDLVVNIAAPAVVLTWLSGDAWLGPLWGLVVALAFPLGHAAWTLTTSARVSPLAVLALVSVALTGGIGLFELPVRWFAVKEAAVSFTLGMLAVASLVTPWPVLPALLREVLDGARVQAALTERGTAAAYQATLRRGTWWLGLVLVLTGVGTFFFARAWVTAPTGSEAFAQQLGRYTALSLPVLGLPSALGSMAVLWRVLLGIEAAAGQPLDELVAGED